MFRLDRNPTPKLMARRKFRHSQRPDPQGERTHQEYLLNHGVQTTTRSELLRLIRGGEDTYLELKVKLSNTEKITQGIVALANTNGGTLVFGVNDQLRLEGLSDPEGVRDEITRICREDVVPPIVPLIDMIAFDSGTRILAVDIEPRRRPYRTRDGRFYMRFGAEKREVSREHISMWLDEIRPLGYENIPLFDGDEEDFDDGLMWTFANEFESDSRNIDLYRTADFLKKDLLLAVGNGDDFFPTVAGVMLFVKNDRIEKLFPRAKVVVTRFSGDTVDSPVIERAEIHGNLLTQFERILAFTARYCDLLKHKPKKPAPTDAMYVRPRAAYNLYAVREAVANAIVHRDLAFVDIPTRINIYDSHIEFINARRTNGFVPPASRAIRFGITQRLNPQISSIFNRREYGAAVPRGGLPMVLKQAENMSGKRAELYTSNDEFRLKIHGLY